MWSYCGMPFGVKQHIFFRALPMSRYELMTQCSIYTPSHTYAPVSIFVSFFISVISYDPLHTYSAISCGNPICQETFLHSLMCECISCSVIPFFRNRLTSFSFISPSHCTELLLRFDLVSYYSALPHVSFLSCSIRYRLVLKLITLSFNDKR